MNSAKSIKKLLISGFSLFLLTFCLSACDVLFLEIARKYEAAPPNTVTFEPNGGVFPSGVVGDIVSVEVTSGSAVSEWPPLPSWTDSSLYFQGWNTLPDGSGFPFGEGSTVNADMTVYAQWGTGSASHFYTVVFDPAGGSSVSPPTQTVSAANGFKVTRPANPEKKGYDFVDWYYDEPLTGERLWNFASDQAEDNITLFAKWNPRTYSLTYHENNGVITPRTETISSIVFNTVLTIRAIGEFTPVFSPPDGHVFLNWNTSTDPANPPATRFHPGQALNILPGWGDLDTGEAINLYAHWADDNSSTLFTVDFSLNGGNLEPHLPPVTGLASGAYITKPANDPVRAGYTFSGWYNTPLTGGSEWGFDGDTSPIPVTGNTTLFARWTVRTYNVIYNANSGGGDPVSITVSYDTPTAIAAASTFTPPLGHHFINWNSESGTNPAATSFFPGQSVINIPGWDGMGDTPTVTLYAKWVLNTYTVRFNSNLGSHVPIKSADHGTTITAPDAPERPLHTFAGWWTEDGTGDEWGDEWIFETDPVTENITLYAKWTPMP